jgi:hypothetical protein
MADAAYLPAAGKSGYTPGAVRIHLIAAIDRTSNLQQRANTVVWVPYDWRAVPAISGP